MRARTFPAWLIAAAIVALDQFTKQLCVERLAPGASIPVLPPVLSLTLVHNTGAAFGLFKGQQTLFMGLSLIVIAWIGRELLIRPLRRTAVLWGCALILGGAVGNLIDRLRMGSVIDFIDLRVWPVFNVADSAITIGVILLIWRSLRHR